MGCGGSQPAKGEEKKNEQQQSQNQEQKPAENNSQNDKAAVVPAASPSSDTASKSNPKVLVLFYSTYGHLYHMAKAVAEGAREGGATVDLKRVPETLPLEVLEKMHAVEAQKAFADVPVAEPSELANYDAIIFGSPTRFGNMAAQMQTFLDATGGLWFSGALVGKVGGVFVGTATQHGGQEATIRHFHTTLFHHGFIVVGLPYSYQAQMGFEEVKGCSPYGASTIAGAQGERQPSKIELDGAHFQGKHIATIAGKLLVK